MKIILLTLSPEASFLERFYLWFRKYIKNLLFYYGGPEAVLESLIRGFDKLKIDYQLNPKASEIRDNSTVSVLSDVKTLRWAIAAKKEGKVKKIIAGPTIAMPLDANRIIFDNTIDIFIVPSSWVKEFCDFFCPGFRKKIRVWAAGVENPQNFQEKPRKGCLVYKKNVDKELFDFIIWYLKSNNIDYKLIKWGRYKKENYFEILNKVKFMIYLSESESQGLALHEAWMHNVPTLVWNGGHLKTKVYEWTGSTPAPYLTEQCGMFFKNEKDFSNKLSIFLANLNNFCPRDYSLKNFTNEICVSKYLNIIKETEELS